MASFDPRLDQAGQFGLTLEDHSRVVSLDGDAYRGLKGVVSRGERVAGLHVGAVCALTTFHILYLSEALAEVQRGGPECTGCFNDIGGECVFGCVQVPVFFSLSRLPIFRGSTGSPSQ